jgi:predicted ester cyclase
MATQAPPSPPASATNAELIRWSFEVLKTPDVTPLRANIWTQDTVVTFPGRSCHGDGEIAAYFEEVFAALPDFRIEARTIAEQDEHVFAQWHLTGTHTGADFQGIEATGKPLALDGIDHYVLRDGRVVSNFVIYDQMEFARQSGLLPREGSGADRALKLAFNAKTTLESRIREARSPSR